MACTALVPLDMRQQCAMAAIAKVEARMSAGRSLPEFPYAKAFFRELSGQSIISSRDIRLVDSAYDPSVRGGSTKTDYIKAIDIMIESRGEQWILPLSKSVLITIFPASSGRQIQRRDHREQISLERSERREEQKKREKMLAAENAKCNAWIALQFCLPGNHKSWLQVWRDEMEGAGITEWEIRAMLTRWWSAFWIATVRTDWRWCDSMYEFLNELDYVLETSSSQEIDLCRAALPLALPHCKIMV
ncbi:plasmid SOS inhibition protein A [Klebsiella sp. CN_Kp114]|uniref:plasmid SOS inhibition protein A n=1 Tax=unclassified Klebsiella TaxID=2608929 RepID=UPI0032B4376E